LKNLSTIFDNIYEVKPAVYSYRLCGL